MKTIDDLKCQGHYFTAGALARQTGRDASYGCHFRSELEYARSEYLRGWEAAK